MQSHPKIKFYCTGDLNQLEPINNNLNNITDSKKYLDKCISILFPNRITLEINKSINLKVKPSISQISKKI